MTRPPSPGRLDLEALLWVGAVRAGLWLLPLGRVRRGVAWVARQAASRRRGAPPRPLLVGRAVRATTRAVPRATCLVQALAAQGMLTRLGHEADLHIAASRDEQAGAAGHAWVECGGRAVVGDGPGVHAPLGHVGL